MRLSLIVCLSWTIAFLPVQPDPPAATLLTLDAEAFMRAMAPIAAASYNREGADSEIPFLITRELNLRFTRADLAAAPFDVLLDFHDALAIGANPHLAVDLYEWYGAMLDAALGDAPTESLPPHIVVGPFEIHATPVEFAQPGASRILLHVVERLGREFYALAGPPSVLLPTPIVGLFLGMISRHMPESGQLTLRQIADFDGDLANEILFKGDGYGHWARCGALYLIDCDDGVIIDRVADRLSYCVPWDGRGVFTDTYALTADYDLTTEGVLRLVETLMDNRGCQAIRERVYTVATDHFSDTITYDIPSECAVVDPTPTPASVTEPPSTEFDPAVEIASFVHYPAFRNLRDGDYAANLQQIDQYLNMTDEGVEIYAPELRYVRALTLEFKGDSAAALAEYIALYQADPDSLIGMMAAAHYESAG